MVKFLPSYVYFYDSVVVLLVTGRTICQQTNSQSVNSRTSQFAEAFDLTFAINNCYKCDLR